MVLPRDASIGDMWNISRNLCSSPESRDRKRKAVRSPVIIILIGQLTSDPRKLMTIDYIGTALSLGGCTLVMLPLIWVWFVLLVLVHLLNTYLSRVE